MAPDDLCSASRKKRRREEEEQRRQHGDKEGVHDQEQTKGEDEEKQTTNQVAMDEILAQQLALKAPSRPRTRAHGPTHSAMQTPQQPQNCTSGHPGTDGFMVREPWQMVGAHVQCLFSDAAHLKSCGKFPGAPRDNKPCDCKWWDATITEDNKSLGFTVTYMKNDTNEGWEEHDVDISRLRRTELGPEPAIEVAVERNLTTMLGIAATGTKWQQQWSSDWLEANAAGALFSFFRTNHIYLSELIN